MDLGWEGRRKNTLWDLGDVLEDYNPLILSQWGTRDGSACQGIKVFAVTVLGVPAHQTPSLVRVSFTVSLSLFWHTALCLWVHPLVLGKWTCFSHRPIDRYGVTVTNTLRTGYWGGKQASSLFISKEKEERKSYHSHRDIIHRPHSGPSSLHLASDLDLLT